MDPHDLSAWLSDAAGACSSQASEKDANVSKSSTTDEAAQRLSAELLRATQDPEGCVRLRGGGDDGISGGNDVFEAAAGLLYGPGSWEDKLTTSGSGSCPSPHWHLPRLSVRRRAAAVLRNLARAPCADPRERRFLRQLDRVRLHCDCVRATLCRCGSLPRGQPADSEDARAQCSEALASLLELSYSPAERALLARLGGVECLADLLLADYCQTGASPPPTSRFLRRCAACALTNLSYGDSACKRRLCRRGPALRCLIEQVSPGPSGPPPDPELCQAAAAVLRNLSWQADPACRVVLARIGAAVALARAAVSVVGSDEATLRGILSALWNLTAHSPTNQAAVCEVPEILTCLCRCLNAEGASATLSECAGGVLRNLAHVITSHERLRVAIRPSLPLLLRHLHSPSPTIVANACGILRCLSAGHPADARILCRLGVEQPLRRLLQSRHRVIADACAAALANLAPASTAQGELDAAYASLPRLRRPTLSRGHRPNDPLWTASFPVPGGPNSLGGAGVAGSGFGPLAMSAWERQGRAERGLYPLLEEAPVTPDQPVGSVAASELAAPKGQAASSSDIELSDLSNSLSSVIEIDAAAMVRGSQLASDTDLEDVEDEIFKKDSIDVENDDDPLPVGEGGGFDLSTPSSPSAKGVSSFPCQPQPPQSRPALSIRVRASAASATSGSTVSHLPLPCSPRSTATSTVPVAAFSTLPRRRPQLLDGGSLPRRRPVCHEEAPRPALISSGAGGRRQSGPSLLPTARLPLPTATAFTPLYAPSSASKKKPLGVVAPTVVRPPPLPSAVSATTAVPVINEAETSGGKSPPSRVGLPHCRLSSLSKDSGYADSLLSNSASLTPVGGADDGAVGSPCDGFSSVKVAVSSQPQSVLPKSLIPEVAHQTRPARKQGSGIPVKAASRPTARSDEAAAGGKSMPSPPTCATRAVGSAKVLAQKQLPTAASANVNLRQTTTSSNIRRLKCSRSAPPS